MKRFLAFLLCLLILFSLCACTGAGDKKPEKTEAPTPSPSEEPEEAECTPLMYKVTDGKGGVLYVLGSIHVADDRAKDMPDYKFIWFGKTPLYSVPHKIRKAVKTKLPNLTFAGYVQPDELKQAYVGCDVYIFPTLEETEGIVLLEALAAKANVIVRDIPVFDWLNGGTDCYKAKDKDEFERMIKEIYEGKLPSLRENGRKAVENMDIKKIGEKLVKIYNGTAEGGD